MLLEEGGGLPADVDGPPGQRVRGAVEEHVRHTRQRRDDDHERPCVPGDQRRTLS